MLVLNNLKRSGRGDECWKVPKPQSGCKLRRGMSRNPIRGASCASERRRAADGPSELRLNVGWQEEKRRRAPVSEVRWTLPESTNRTTALHRRGWIVATRSEPSRQKRNGAVEFKGQGSTAVNVCQELLVSDSNGRRELRRWGSSGRRERVCGRGGIRKNCGNLWKNQTPPQRRHVFALDRFSGTVLWVPSRFSRRLEAGCH